MSDLRYRFLVESIYSLTRIGNEENISEQLKQSKDVLKFLDDGR